MSAISQMKKAKVFQMRRKAFGPGGREHHTHQSPAPKVEARPLRTSRLKQMNQMMFHPCAHAQHLVDSISKQMTISSMLL